MTKNELVTLVKNSNKKMFALVGPNNSGKSYFLYNDLFNSLDNNAFFLDEQGGYQVKGEKRKIIIGKDLYYYENEEMRGRGVAKAIGESISQSSKNIIDFISQMMNKNSYTNMSLGTLKLHNIYTSIMKYNLNHIEYILLDEPENSLDDRAIKYIQTLINTLVVNGKKVFFVTHSPRLLELLQIEIDDIYVLPKIGDELINHTRNEIYELFDKIGTEILNKKREYTISNISKCYFKPQTELRKFYIDTILKQYDFYSSLFYSHIVLVEGRTEELLATLLSDKLNFSRCIYNANGKYNMPFLLNFFKFYCGKVTCIIDSDESKKDFPKDMTAIIKNYKVSNDKCEVNVYEIPNDIEGFLGISVNEVISKLTGVEEVSSNFHDQFIRNYKHYISTYVVNNDDEKKQKILDIFNRDERVYEF